MAVGLHVRGVGYTCKHSKICALEALLTVTMRFYQCSTGGAGVGTLGWLIHRLPRLLPRDAACGGSVGRALSAGVVTVGAGTRGNRG